MKIIDFDSSFATGCPPDTRTPAQRRRDEARAKAELLAEQKRQRKVDLRRARAFAKRMVANFKRNPKRFPPASQIADLIREVREEAESQYD